jgi:hypothetical protein
MIKLEPAEDNMEYLIGLILAGAAFCFATVVGLARDRSFYPTVLIVIGSYYALFGAMAASRRTLVVECLAGGIFVLFAAFGFRKNLWLVVAAMIGHGLFDFVHHSVINNPGVPPWWPGFCAAFDIILGMLLAFQLIRHPRLSRATRAV